MSLRLILLLSLGVLVSACGGGGGGEITSAVSTPTDPNQSFSLSKLQSTTLGTTYSAQLTGIDSSGNSYTGSIAQANRAQVMLNGVLVTPQDLILNLSGSGTSSTITGTNNIDTSGNLISYVGQTSGLTCTPVSPGKIPATVQIGDFGIRSATVCSNNTTIESNWRVVDAGNGRINLISSGTTKNQLNTVVSVSDVTFTIDGNANIIAFKTVATISASNFTLTYQSL
jgi:hypothetical protein